MTADQYFGFDPVDKQGYKEWPIFLGIVGCHTMLNVLGFRPDGGLTKPSDIPGILSDGSHIAHAAYCQGLLSRDQKLIAKARAIYYKNIGTQVLNTWNIKRAKWILRYAPTQPSSQLIRRTLSLRYFCLYTHHLYDNVYVKLEVL